MRSMPEGKPLQRPMAPHGKDFYPKNDVTRMSIRMVAVELYRVMKEIEELEKKLASSRPGSREERELDEKLRVARAEKARLKNMIEGAKDD